MHYNNLKVEFKLQILQKYFYKNKIQILKPHLRGASFLLAKSFKCISPQLHVCNAVGLQHELDL